MRGARGILAALILSFNVTSNGSEDWRILVTHVLIAPTSVRVGGARAYLARLG
jgi:hypothetical protein